MYGYEALARFPAGDESPPDRWFSEAAAVGLGTVLQAAAVRNAIALLPSMPPAVGVWLNVSAELLSDLDVIALLTGPRAARLVVELTEHAQIESYDKLAVQLGLIRAAGARIAVDDAGSGYAGLEHILRLQPEVLKLDRVLVNDVARNPGRQAMIEALVGFAKRVGALLVAEGIESEEDVRMLRGLGVAYGQGFHLHPPRIEFPNGD